MSSGYRLPDGPNYGVGVYVDRREGLPMLDMPEMQTFKEGDEVIFVGCRDSGCCGVIHIQYLSEEWFYKKDFIVTAVQGDHITVLSDHRKAAFNRAHLVLKNPEVFLNGTQL